MLIIRGISPDVVGYYIDGRPDRPPGHWAGSGCAELGVTGLVHPADLKRVLQGRRPDDGRYLPKRKPPRRRAGWDLMFSAPKSVSLLDALLPPGETTVQRAHQAAVGAVLSHLEKGKLVAPSVRLSAEAAEAAGAVAAVFEHRQNAAAEPHLHSHVLLANLASTPHGNWVSPNTGQWRNERRALFALYQLEIRHDLARAGWDLDWRIRADGTADLADVPRAAVRATSSQTWSTHERGRFETRRLATAQPWLDRSVAHGFGPEDAPARPAVADGRRAVPADGLNAPDLDHAVAKRILAERSVFRRCDVAVALAACLPHGAAIDAVDTWTDRFLMGAQLVPSVWSTPRWTTALAAESDRRLAGVIKERSLGSPVPGDIEPALAHFAYLTDTERQAVERLVTSGNRVEIIGNPAGQSGLMAAAAVIDAGRTAWQADGLSVAVMCSAGDAARWEALAGLVRYQSGPMPDVLVVDRADRRATPDLLSLLTATPERTRLILVEGGTMPRLSSPASTGLSKVGDELGRIHPGGLPPRPTPTPAPDGPERGVPVRTGCERSGRQAVGELVDSWAQRWTATSQVHLVGLGIDEVSELNRRARDALFQGAGAGAEGTEVRAGGRLFRAGDRVIALHGPTAGTTTGTEGWVAEVHPPTRRVDISWDDGGDAVVRGRDAQAVGYAYALLPRMATRVAGSVLLLGSERDAPGLRAKILETARAAPPMALPHRRDHVADIGLPSF